MSEILLTPDGFAKLSAERTQLEAERETLVERMRTALEFGGAFPENGDYLDARHELELLDRRLARLEDRLHGAEVVAAFRDGEAGLGEVVTVLDLDTSAVADYRLVGSGEGDPAAGDVSYESPLGAALVGRRVGDVVEVDAPRGRRRFEVVSVDG